MPRLRPLGIILLLSLILGLALSTPTLNPRKVHESAPLHESFFLTGSASANWNNTGVKPGPLIKAFDGDTVTIMFNSVDSLFHTWFLDVNNNGIADTGEPNSFPPTGTSTTSFVSFTFTPKSGTNIPGPGNYTYRCGVHPGLMFGTFEVLPAAISSSVSTTSTLDSSNVATSGTLTVDMRTLNVSGTVTVTATDSTSGATTFTKTYAIPSIPLQTVSSTSKQALFGVNVAVTPYALSVEVKVVLQGTTVTGATVLTRELDINGNGQVDIIDASIGAIAFGTSVGDPKYNPQADWLAHGTVDIIDFGVFAFYFNAQIFH